jgi:uncharacterized protein
MSTVSKRSFLKKFFYFFIIPFSIVVLIFSYIALKKLVFPSDFLMKDGRFFSEHASRKRAEFLKNENVKLVTFPSKDGTKLVGFLIKRSKAIGNILLCHGYQGSKESMLGYVNLFPEYNILLFDFRAHGQSEGKFRTLGCHEYKDVIAAAEFLRENTRQPNMTFNFLPQIILGFSMGGAACLHAVGFDPTICDLLIADSAFSDLRNAMYYSFTLKSSLLYTLLPFIERVINYWANCDIAKTCPCESLKKFNKPIFFIHSCADSVVPPKDSLLMFSCSTNEKNKLWIGPKCAHGKLHKKYSEIYRKKVTKFIRKALA